MLLVWWRHACGCIGYVVFGWSDCCLSCVDTGQATIRPTKSTQLSVVGSSRHPERLHVRCTCSDNLTTELLRTDGRRRIHFLYRLLITCLKRALAEFIVRDNWRTFQNTVWTECDTTGGCQCAVVRNVTQMGDVSVLLWAKGRKTGISDNCTIYDTFT